MNTLTEALPPCAPIVSEANGYRSRSTVTIPAATVIRVGMVLGKLTAGGAVPLDPAAATGAEEAGAIALYPVTTGADQSAATTVLDTDAEVRASDLEWPAGITAPQKAAAIAQLLALGIKLR